MLARPFLPTITHVRAIQARSVWVNQWRWRTGSFQTAGDASADSLEAVTFLIIGNFDQKLRILRPVLF